jgi:hypothetical protein
MEKTCAQLRKFLQENGVQAPSRLKKADLVELAEAVKENFP